MAIHLTAPLSLKDVKRLHAGDSVLLSGVVYTARDAAHERMARAIEKGEPLPVSLEGQTLYYAGPTPTPPGKAVGAIGPTTSTRMDAYTPLLLSLGLRAMIGKGKRSPQVISAMGEHPAVYFAAVGGAAALMAQCVTSCEVVAYEDLGTESIKRLTLRELPLIVAVDCYGGDYYELGQQRYGESLNRQA